MEVLISYIIFAVSFILGTLAMQWRLSRIAICVLVTMVISLQVSIDCLVLDLSGDMDVIYDCEFSEYAFIGPILLLLGCVLIYYIEKNIDIGQRRDAIMGEAIKELYREQERRLNERN